MTTARQTQIGQVQITLEARDQFNDYSVIYDHFITVNYGNGRTSRHDVGTNKSEALAKYDAAVSLARWHNAPKLSAKLGQS